MKKWKCKICNFETDSGILQLTHILENHPEISKETILSACEFYKKYCNRMKDFLEIHGDELTNPELITVGEYLANDEYDMFNMWLFDHSFNHLLE
ncbi:hypothetical protein B6U98_02270 [Thermoplasmatales archaeon ex4572_165]|nr:MAG: hypothetical protein B6U98_02270 [Thermoplasmatales archaeon ex4572_165]RLF60044.1 MAG: hypothetical protein DRN27_00850 [Thermoplasmata archaeon]